MSSAHTINKLFQCFIDFLQIDGIDFGIDVPGLKPAVKGAAGVTTVHVTTI
jgi:hypothetical protein